MPTAWRMVLTGLLAIAAAAAAPVPRAAAETAPPAAASPEASGIGALVEALRLGEIFAIMQEEGRAYGAELEEEMFPGRGGPSWAAEVDAIYDAEKILPAFTERLQAELGADGAGLAPVIGFFGSATGRKAIELEVSARRALLDEAVEDAAKLRAAEMREERDPRFAALVAFAEANDLVEANVSSGLNASLAFYAGLAESGAIGEAHSEQDMLDDVWSQEPALRADTEEWVYAFIALAYGPLSDAELADYTAFSLSPEGRRLNRALFAAFDAVLSDISRALGRAAGRRLTGEDI